MKSDVYANEVLTSNNNTTTLPSIENFIISMVTEKPGRTKVFVFHEQVWNVSKLILWMIDD